MCSGQFMLCNIIIASVQELFRVPKQDVKQVNFKTDKYRVWSNNQKVEKVERCNKDIVVTVKVNHDIAQLDFSQVVLTEISKKCISKND